MCAVGCAHQFLDTWHGSQRGVGEVKLDEPMEAEDHTVAEAGPDGQGEAESLLEVSKGWLSVVPISF